MCFFAKQPQLSKDKYIEMLSLMGAFSKLYSESSIPYLYYRVAENIFCKVFEANNMSRSDISVDATKNNFGIGLKTFLYKNGSCIEKIAEFNRQRKLFADENNNLKKLIEIIANLRNQRIMTTVNITGVEKLIYHCVVRKEKEFILYETNMDLIDICNIRNLKIKENVITFDDKKNEYGFNISKSTLFKRFNVNPITKFDVIIHDDPFSVLAKLLETEVLDLKKVILDKEIAESVILPLYSTRGIISVPQKSGLNQWNANGRIRDISEIYIPVPMWIHKKFPNFFPSRNTSFNLFLPDGTCLSAKICQDNGKALMSNPNKALGEWLLRKVLKLEEGRILTYELLESKNIDSVEVLKKDNGYYMNFKKLGSYEDFRNDSCYLK